MPEAKRTVRGLFAVGAIGTALALGGCSLGGNDAEAQTSLRIETFLIEPDSLVILVDSPPTIEVDGEATVYTITSDGTLTFDLAGGATSPTLVLDANDILIERPGSGTLTFVRE